ncbi:Uncharacterised protein [Bordetella pertussis]|nr:Uncharacterised protein [Bordetella pertussis]
MPVLRQAFGDRTAYPGRGPGHEGGSHTLHSCLQFVVMRNRCRFLSCRPAMPSAWPVLRWHGSWRRSPAGRHPIAGKPPWRQNRPFRKCTGAPGRTGPAPAAAVREE